MRLKPVGLPVFTLAFSLSRRRWFVGILLLASYSLPLFIAPQQISDQSMSHYRRKRRDWESTQEGSSPSKERDKDVVAGCWRVGQGMCFQNSLLPLMTFPSPSPPSWSRWSSSTMGATMTRSGSHTRKSFFPTPSNPCGSFFPLLCSLSSFLPCPQCHPRSNASTRPCPCSPERRPPRNYPFYARPNRSRHYAPRRCRRHQVIMARPCCAGSRSSRPWIPAQRFRRLLLQLDRPHVPIFIYAHWSRHPPKSCKDNRNYRDNLPSWRTHLQTIWRRRSKKRAKKVDPLLWKRNGFGLLG